MADVALPCVLCVVCACSEPPRVSSQQPAVAAQSKSKRKTDARTLSYSHRKPRSAGARPSSGAAVMASTTGLMLAGCVLGWERQLGSGEAPARAKQVREIEMAASQGHPRWKTCARQRR